MDPINILATLILIGLFLVFLPALLTVAFWLAVIIVPLAVLYAYRVEIGTVLGSIEMPWLTGDVGFAIVMIGCLVALLAAVFAWDESNQRAALKAQAKKPLAPNN